MAVASRPVQTVLDALESRNCHPKKSGDAWMARCPSHDDRQASLSIGQGGDGRALLHDHAGCAPEAVLFSLGLDFADTFEKEDRPAAPERHGFDEIEATYDYTDLEGKLLYQVVRFKGKKFRQRRPDDKGGWIWSVRGVDRVPYRLPLVDDAVKRGLVIVVCYSEDTEVLTPEGWVKFPDLVPRQRVLQWSSNEEVSFVEPSDRQVFKYDGPMINLRSVFSDLLVTPEHRCIVKYEDCAPKVVAAGAFHRGMHIPVCGHLNSSGYGPTPDEARLLTAWQADGGYANKVGFMIGWNLKKERKKERLRQLLRALNIDWRERVFRPTPDWTYFDTDIRNAVVIHDYMPDKLWTWDALNWSLLARRAILDEIGNWDGDHVGSRSVRFFTAEQQNAEVVSAMAAITGRGSIVRNDDRPQRFSRRRQYVVNLNNNRWRSFYYAPDSVRYKGNVYCLTVPSGFLVVRRNGRTVVSGNCEGEKDCDAINRVGKGDFVATTNSGGAGKWEPHFAHYLAGARVIVVQDKDDPGRKHASDVAESLRGLAKSVRIVEAADGKDAFDHIKAGHGIEDFVPVEEGEPGEPGAEAYHLSDTGNAIRFADQHHGTIRYVHDWKEWVLWDERCWRRDETGTIQDAVRATLGAMWDEARARRDEARTRLMRHALATEADRRRAALLNIACADRRIATTSRTLDLAPWLLNLRNGTMELLTQAIREHRQSDYLTHCLDIDYDPEAECPRWRDFLIQIMDGRTEIIDFLQRAVGYSLTGSTREQAFFMLYGTGSNGKSTFLEVIRALLGSLAQNADFGTFLHREHETVRDDIARMRAARLVTAVEAEGDRRFSETILKSLTGSDTITARHLYSKHFEFKPAFKLWFAANHRPVIRGTDHAIWRRVRLVPFTVTIPKEEQDQDLADKLIEELPGILAWAVEGCRIWLEKGLGIPEDVADATAEYRDDMDPIGPFIDECCVLGKFHRTRASDMFRAYTEWAERTGRPRFSNITLGNVLRESGRPIEPIKAGGTRYWIGIGLLDARRFGEPEKETRVEAPPPAPEGAQAGLYEEV